MNRLANAAVSGFNDYKKVMDRRQEIMRDAGFLLPVDEKFKTYFAGYKRQRKDYGTQSFMTLPDGTKLTLGDSQLQKLKRKIWEAILRVTNQSA